MAMENSKSGTAMKIVEKIKPQPATKPIRKSRPASAADSVFEKFDNAIDVWLSRIFLGIGRLVRAVGCVLSIIPAVTMGLLEGLSRGMLISLQKATASYEKFLEDKSNEKDSA